MIPTNNNSRQSVLSTLIIGVVLVVCIVAVTLLTITRSSESALVGFLTTTIVPSVLTLVTLGRVESMGRDVQQIQRQTNGPLDHLRGQVATLVDQQAAAGGAGRHAMPPPPPPPAERPPA